MRYSKDFDLNTFDAWSGAKDTKETIIEHGKTGLFNAIIEDMYEDIPTETQINDLLWHDSDWIYEVLEIKID